MAVHAAANSRAVTPKASVAGRQGLAPLTKKRVSQSHRTAALCTKVIGDWFDGMATTTLTVEKVGTGIVQATHMHAQRADLYDHMLEKSCLAPAALGEQPHRCLTYGGA